MIQKGDIVRYKPGRVGMLSPRSRYVVLERVENISSALIVRRIEDGLSFWLYEDFLEPVNIVEQMYEDYLRMEMP